MTSLRHLFAVLLVAGPAVADEVRPRAVSMAPSLTEMIFDLGLGAHLVARSSACDAPPEAAALPVAGPFGQPNVEALHRIAPDVVFFTDLERPGLAGTLESLGIRARVLPCEGWTQMMAAARSIATALGEPAKGEAWIERMEARRSALAFRVDAAWSGRARPSVYVEIWGDPLTSAGRASFLSDLVSLAGGRNIGDALATAYPHVSAEWLLRENPDTIVLAYMLPGATPAIESLARRPGWSTLRAVRERRIATEIPPDWLLRPGPRWIEGAERLADFLLESDRAP